MCEYRQRVNGHIIEFCLQNQKLESPYKTPSDTTDSRQIDLVQYNRHFCTRLRPHTRKNRVKWFLSGQSSLLQALRYCGRRESESERHAKSWRGGKKEWIDPQFPPVLFSCSRFRNSPDPTTAFMRIRAQPRISAHLE